MRTRKNYGPWAENYIDISGQDENYKDISGQDEN